MTAMNAIPVSATAWHQNHAANPLDWPARSCLPECLQAPRTTTSAAFEYMILNEKIPETGFFVSTIIPNISLTLTKQPISFGVY
jgi:hypothetical protein